MRACGARAQAHALLLTNTIDEEKAWKVVATAGARPYMTTDPLDINDETDEVGSGSVQDPACRTPVPIAVCFRHIRQSRDWWDGVRVCGDRRLCDGGADRLRSTPIAFLRV